MGFIKDIFSPPIDNIQKAIKKWNPKNCSTEKEYENSLYDYLHEKFKDYDIKKQYGIAREKVDIVVNDKIAIELKIKFKTTAAYQRLKGQLDTYIKHFDYTIIVLGRSLDKDLFKDLEKHVESINESIFLVDKEKVLILKI